MEAFRTSGALIDDVRPAGRAREIRVGDGDPRVLLLRVHRRAGGGMFIDEDMTELRRLQRVRSPFIDNLNHGTDAAEHRQPPRRDPRP
jgi:hypothetical protein